MTLVTHTDAIQSALDASPHALDFIPHETFNDGYIALIRPPATPTYPPLQVYIGVTRRTILVTTARRTSPLTPAVNRAAEIAVAPDNFIHHLTNYTDHYERYLPLMKQLTESIRCFVKLVNSSLEDMNGSEARRYNTTITMDSTELEQLRSRNVDLYLGNDLGGKQLIASVSTVPYGIHETTVDPLTFATHILPEITTTYNSRRIIFREYSLETLHPVICNMPSLIAPDLIWNPR